MAFNILIRISKESSYKHSKMEKELNGYLHNIGFQQKRKSKKARLLGQFVQVVRSKGIEPMTL